MKIIKAKVLAFACVIIVAPPTQPIFLRQCKVLCSKTNNWGGGGGGGGGS